MARRIMAHPPEGVLGVARDARIQPQLGRESSLEVVLCEAPGFIFQRLSGIRTSRSMIEIQHKELEMTVRSLGLSQEMRGRPGSLSHPFPSISS